LDGYSALNRAIVRRSRRIVFITDAAIWNCDSLRQARLAQWCELCTYITRTAIVYVGADAPGKFPRTASQLARFTDLYSPGADAENALRVIDTLRRSYEIIEVVLSVKGEFGRSILDALKERVPYVTLDIWLPELAATTSDHGQSAGADLWLTSEHEEKDIAAHAISTTAMRYLPAGLDAWRKKSSSHILLALATPNAADLVGIDLLAGTEEIANLVWLADFRPDEEGGDESALFAILKQRDMPRIIISVGQSNRAAEVARCMAAYWGIEYFRVSAAEFPCMLGSDLSLVMCSSFADIADYLCTQINAETRFATHSGDVGWSTYWRVVTKRKSADHARHGPVATSRDEFRARA
jgi:hypothetical protein